jgi:Tfp pilus assembly protein PilV
MYAVNILNFFKKTKNKQNNGSSLIELLIAIVLITSTLTALVSGMAYTMRTLAEAEFRSRATDLAAECMDDIRKNRIIDGWLYFQQNASSEVLTAKYEKCQNPDTDSTIKTTFTRAPTCTIIDADEVKCEVIVNWKAFGGNVGSDPNVTITQIFKHHQF